MKSFVARRPLFLCVLLTLGLLVLAFASSALLPTVTISKVEDLAPEALEVPSAGEQAFAAVWSFESLFWLLASLFALAFIWTLGWWREIGFSRLGRWRNLQLLIFPLLVGGLALLGGVRIPTSQFFAATLFVVLAAVFGEEAIYRGVAWRALAPGGLLRAVVATSLLAGAMRFGFTMLASPWPEAVQATVLAVCGGFTYAALRWRTASIWPVIMLHSILGFVGAVATPGAAQYLVVLFASTLGFVIYGLFLLRNPRVRADGA